jgi:localization factor PodJL
LPWSVKGVDPRTRDAAKAAARRAGMTLGEWLDHKILEEAEDGGVEAETKTNAPEQLDIAALSERLARLSQGQMDTSPPVATPRNAPPALSRGEIDAVITQAAAAERLTRESSAKTAGALDSIARWIEKTESRLTTGERSAAERQERATSVIADAIKTMGERIADMERKAIEVQRAPAKPAPRLAFSRDGLADAVSDIRTRQRALDHDDAALSRSQPALPESRIAALRQDLRDLSARIVPPGPAPSSTRPHVAMPAMQPERDPQSNPIEAMLADLGTRLDRLDRRDRFDPVMKPLARIESEVSRLSQGRAGESYQRVELELGHLAAKVDALAARGGEPLDPVMRPLARIESEISRLSQERSGESYQRVELELGHLAAKVDALAARGGDRTMLAPVLRDIAELRDMVAAKDGDPRLDELSRQILDLSSDMSRLREAQPDGRELRSLAIVIEDVRDAIMADRGHDRHGEPAALQALSRQIDNLASKIETLPAMRPELINAQAEQLAAKLGELDSTGSGASNALSQRIETLVAKLEDLADRQPSRIESRIDTLQQRIETLAEQGPTGVTRQIEALAGRIESLVASSNLTQMVSDDKSVHFARVDLRPIEEMLRGLAEKIEEAGKPGAETDAFDSLEQQISGLAQRLDAAAATRSAETGIERTLQDLVVHLQTMRQDTTEVAERAARAAVSGVGGKGAPSNGLTELSNLVTGLRETHVSSGRETQDAIGAVHQTLETIISRLASIEADLVGERKPFAAAAQQPARQPEKPRPAVMPAARMPDNLGKVSIGLEDRIAQDRSPAIQAEEPALSSLDLPLEPGSGRPQVTSTLAPGQDAQSVRQNLIAAARRSAKAATEAAAAPSATPEPEKSGGKLKEIMEKRRRPILLGLAAIVLAMGTAHVVTGALRGGKATPANNSAVQAPEQAAPEAPAPTPMEPTAPAKDQSSTLEPAPAQAVPSMAAPSLAANAAPDATGSTMQMPSIPAPMAQETLQPATGLGELPAGLGSAGLRKAALAGDAKAVYELASRAAEGPAATRDAKLALRLFERAAVAGLAPAQFRVGNMFEKGVGTPRDVNLARVWYTRAAEHGNAKAMHNLAVLHAEGVSGKPDYAAATEWFRRAAEFGVRDSQYNLAILLGRGLGAPVDLSQSYVWFAVAAAQGDTDAGRKREEVGQKLNATDLAAAKVAAETWKPRPLAAAANDVVPPAKGWDEAPSAADRKPAKQVRG